MADIEEAMCDNDVVHEPETPMEAPTPVSAASDDTNKNVEGEALQADSTSSEGTNSERRSAFRDSHPPVEIICPRINCTEKILFCLDCSSEMNETYFRSRVGDKLSAFRETVKALRMFISNKSRINPNHEYGIAAFTDNAVWLKGFSKPRETIKVLEDITNTASLPAGNFDLDNLFQMLQENVVLPEVTGEIRVVPPPYIVRILFIYGRSHRMPLFTDKQVYHQLEMSPYFFVDVLYVHEPPSDENNCEDIFTRLCELDHKGLSYILEAASLTRLFDCVAMLLAHPLQRPLQRQADYHIASQPPIEEQTV